jgi:hypothetical protein
MRSYRTSLDLIVEVVTATPAHARGLLDRSAGAIAGSLELAVQDTALQIAGVYVVGAAEPVAAARSGAWKYRCTVQVAVNVDVNSETRALEEMSAARGQVHDHVRMTFEEIGVALKDVQIGAVRVKRYYDR